MKHSVYLDYSASTPMDPRVVDAMMPYFTQIFGNPSSAHSFGRKAEQAIEDSRVTIARIFNCTPNEIIFTSGGSESDNLAIRGAGVAAKQAGKGNHLVTTPIEHSAVGRTVDHLVQTMDFERSHVVVNHEGLVDAEEFASVCREGTVVASIIYANNEIGTVQDIPRLAEMAHMRGALFHTDAVQAAGQLTLDVKTLGVDMMSISGHKFYGPKGVGALYVRQGIDIVPSQSGGSHENGRRAGTLNTPFIVGMATALELANLEHEQRLVHYRHLQQLLIDGILQRVPGSHISGHPTNRLPSHISFVFDGIDGNQLLMHLDIRGVAASSASACKSGNPEPSGVLLAMGYSREQALGSLRLSVGHDTTETDVAYAINAIVESLEALRKLKKVLS